MDRSAILINFIKYIKYFWKWNMNLYINISNLRGYLNIAENWEKDGSVIIKGIFNWLILDIKDSQRDMSLLDMVSVEFNIYKYY